MKNKTVINDFLIRDFTEKDYPAVLELWDSTGLSNPERGDDLEAIRNTLDCGGKLIVLIEKSSGIICGTSWLTSDGRRIYLHHFGILPPFQGRGLSRILLKESLDFVKSQGKQVKLEVHRSNRKAAVLYEKFGFRYLGDYDVYIIRDLNEI